MDQVSVWRVTDINHLVKQFYSGFHIVTYFCAFIFTSLNGIMFIVLNTAFCFSILNTMRII